MIYALSFLHPPTLPPTGNPLDISFLVESLNVMQILCQHLGTKFILENIFNCFMHWSKLETRHFSFRVLFYLFSMPNTSSVFSLLLILYAKYLHSVFSVLNVICLSRGFSGLLSAILWQPPNWSLCRSYTLTPVPPLHHDLSYFSTVQICSCQPLAQKL